MRRGKQKCNVALKIRVIRANPPNYIGDNQMGPDSLFDSRFKRKINSNRRPACLLHQYTLNLRFYAATQACSPLYAW